MVIIKQYQTCGGKESTHVGFFGPKCEYVRGLSLKALQFLCQVTDKNALLCNPAESKDETGRLTKPLDKNYLYSTIPYYDADGIFVGMDIILFTHSDFDACKILATISLDHEYKVRCWDAWDYGYLQELLWLYCNGEYLETEILGEDDRPVYRYWDQVSCEVIQIIKA